MVVLIVKKRLLTPVLELMTNIGCLGSFYACGYGTRRISRVAGGDLMRRDDFQLVTKDAFPILFIVLMMLGATCLIMASVFLLDGRLNLAQVLKLLMLAGPGVILIGLGLRRRLVWVGKGTSEVVVTWGNKCPLSIHRYPAGSIVRTQIKQEQRFLVTPIPGGPVRTSRVSDRWRLVGFLQTGKPANLGSYTTEVEAQAVANQVVGVK